MVTYCLPVPVPPGQGHPGCVCHLPDGEGPVLMPFAPGLEAGLEASLLGPRLPRAASRARTPLRTGSPVASGRNRS